MTAIRLAYADHRPIALSPDMIWLLICQGVALSRLGRVREALKDFGGAIQLEPDLEMECVNQEVLPYFAIGDLQGGLRDLNQALGGGNNDDGFSHRVALTCHSPSSQPDGLASLGRAPCPISLGTGQLLMARFGLPTGKPWAWYAMLSNLLFGALSVIPARRMFHGPIAPFGSHDHSTKLALVAVLSTMLGLVLAIPSVFLWRSPKPLPLRVGVRPRG